MRRTRAIALALALLAGNAAAADDYSIGAQLRKDDRQVVDLNLGLTPGGIVSVDTKDGLRLEVVAPNDQDGSGIAKVRLYDDTQTPAKLLHSARKVLLKGEPWRVAYSVCAGKVVFANPAPQSPAACTR